MSFDALPVAVNLDLSIRVLMQVGGYDAERRVAGMLSSMGINEIRSLVAEMEAELNGPEARVAWALRPLLNGEPEQFS